MDRLDRRPLRPRLVAALLPGLLLAGCGGNDDGIKKYTLAYPDRAKTPADVGAAPGPGPASVPNGPTSVRLLGAIIPTDGGSYFVKFVGPAEKVDAYEKDFDAFLNSIKVPGEGGRPVSWTAPPGWVEGKARQMRQVTFTRPDGGAPDLYLSDPFGGTLLDNVNRWLTGDVGIKPVTQETLGTVTKEVTLGTTKAHRVDARGPGGKGGMVAPFAGGR